MKLKKIASLMLAGVMAVSMLTACGSNGNAGNGNNGNENPDPTPATTSVVDAVNKGQSAANAVKIDFTVNSELDNALAKAVSVYGNDADEDIVDITNTGDVIVEREVADAINRMTGLESVSARTGASGYASPDWVDDNGFLTEAVKRDTALRWDKDAKGKVYTLFAVDQFSAWTEEAALNMVAEAADEMIAELDAHSDVDGLKAGDKYYTYGYDGNISMVSVKNLDGTTDYYVAYVVNQTVTESTLK